MELLFLAGSSVLWAGRPLLFALVKLLFLACGSAMCVSGLLVFVHVELLFVAGSSVECIVRGRAVGLRARTASAQG